MRKIGLVAGEFSFNVEETCTIRMDVCVSQGTGGERKGSGSAAGTGESSEGEGEERTGGETKGTRGKKETGEWMSVSARVTLLSALGFKWIFFFYQEEQLRLAAEQKAAKEREAAKQKEAAAKQVNQSKRVLMLVRSLFRRYWVFLA